MLHLAYAVISDVEQYEHVRSAHEICELLIDHFLLFRTQTLFVISRDFKLKLCSLRQIAVCINKFETKKL